jgi:hypothetical protein
MASEGVVPAERLTRPGALSAVHALHQGLYPQPVVMPLLVLVRSHRLAGPMVGMGGNALQVTLSGRRRRSRAGQPA